MIQWLKVAIFPLLLTACVSYSPDFSLPEQVHFHGKLYQKVTDNRLGEMQQLLYLPSDSAKNPENWQQGMLFFLDKNSAQLTLAQRLALRQNVFAKQPNLRANLAIEQGELRSEVIYPPTERFNNVLLEFSRGRNLACGFGQIQFSEKRQLAHNPIAKKGENLTAYQQESGQLATEFAKLPWLIGCK